MMFKNRTDAAQQLAKHLASYKDKHPLVLAIPRGAVPMGKIIANHLHGDLDAVSYTHLTLPTNREV